MPVTFAYISDAHDNHTLSRASGPGEADYVAQLKEYDKAFGDFFQRLASHGIDKRNTLFVSETGAGGGASSYRIRDAGGLDGISSMVMTGQRAACWAVVTRNGRFGYVINAGTGNISGFAIGSDGSATLLGANGITATTGGNPTDAALSHDSRNLYVRVAALGEIAVFSIESDGSLTPRPSLNGTPAGLAGLAAW